MITLDSFLSTSIYSVFCFGSPKICFMSAHSECCQALSTHAHHHHLGAVSITWQLYNVPPVYIRKSPSGCGDGALTLLFAPTQCRRQPQHYYTKYWYSVSPNSIELSGSILIGNRLCTVTNTICKLDRIRHSLLRKKKIGYGRFRMLQLMSLEKVSWKSVFLSRFQSSMTITSFR
jgi:hypothetical protein